MEIAIVVGALVLMLAVELFNRRSIFGKAVVATANDRDAAGLMGINTVARHHLLLRAVLAWPPPSPACWSRR